MNTNRIKKLFEEVVDALPDPAEVTRLPNGPLKLTESLAVFGDMMLYGPVADRYFSAQREMADLASSDGTWSKSSAEKLFADRLAAVMSSDISGRRIAKKREADSLILRLRERPDTWNIALAVFGIAADCDEFAFGRLRFSWEIARSPIHIPGTLEKNAETAYVFAHSSVEAIDKESAVNRATEEIAEHLSVLNALCSEGTPSIRRLSLSTGPGRILTVSRALKHGEADPNTGFRIEHRGILLQRIDLERSMATRGGKTLSERLLTPNGFNQRLISSFALAGHASIEERPQLAFLLYAIAIESAVLGRDTQSELTFQLSYRVAHLLGSNLDSRRRVAAAVVKLYSIRSSIVHKGQTDVSQQDVERIRDVCLMTLHALTITDGLKQMTSVEQLEQWFKDRMLGETSLPET